MNFLSPDDIFSGVRRKSLCNGSLLTLTGKNGANANASANAASVTAESTPSKSSKKERRRGSFNEPTSNNASNTGRRSSLVSRWFKHISDAAEQYKPRSKNANHEPVDDPAIATLPHSNTKESLELTPERPPPLSATATVTTTPLAPMMPPPTVTSAAYVNNNIIDGGVQMRNGRRESTPTPLADSMASHHKQRLSHNELSPASSVNRTMSTRSCGEANNNYADADVNGVTLRHTQSARQATAGNDEGSGVGAGGPQSGTAVAGSKRDSASIVYSNNSNDTRTLMQSSPPLVEPTAIQISISPAHTAEPVLTPAERLRRLDASIRDGLYEKQKIICDMFRLPVEHFHEIVDIAAMPEAPKDSADIALAAYAQVQSLTEVLNDYWHATAEQEISAVSTAVCDQCFEKQQQRQQRPLTPLTTSSSTTSVSASTATQITATHSTEAQATPPPLPPPNKQPAKAQTQAHPQTPTPAAITKLQTPAAALDDSNIHEDDDGYCEIDELRLPALPPLTPAAPAGSKTRAVSPPPPPLPPPAGGFKAPPPPPPPLPTTPAAATATPTPTPTHTPTPTPELVKRQSTLSADSIPEESADEVTQALDDNSTTAATNEHNNKESNDTKAEQATSEASQQHEEIKANETDANADGKDDEEDWVKPQTADGESESEDEAEAEAEVDAEVDAAAAECSSIKTSEQPQRQNSTTEESAFSSEPMEINDAYDTLSTLNKMNAALSMVDDSTQTLPLMLSNMPALGTKPASTGNITCGPNRLQHASSLEPSVPCHALNSIVSALNAQISLLLPKINERDMERDRLRKENQHLRELLNAMHERQRVEAKSETPVDITSSAAAATAAAVNNNEIKGDTDATTTTTITTTSPTATTTVEIATAEN